MWISWMRTHFGGGELAHALENVSRKLQLFAVGLLHLLFSSDGHWAALPPPVDASPSSSTPVSPRRALAYGSDTSKTRTKRVVFVRHAESEWNVVFNRGVWWLAIVRFMRAVVREWLMLPTFDSLFIDSPLSGRGVRQAQALFEDVADKAAASEEGGPPSDHFLRSLASPLPNSIVVTSNLRRAIDTARIGSAARLELPGERIHVLSCLQEIGRNIDTLAISDAYSVPRGRALANGPQSEKRHDELFDLRENHGNKAILGCARARLLAFTTWAFYQDRHDVIVVYGHSHWFRAFCQEFLPATSTHKAKTEKLANCGVVAFELEERRAEHGTQFVIPPASFQYVR